MSPATIRRSSGATRYLLSQQQDFGGWFQTTTHENFRTPMRETRYAVMALAEAFPIKDPAIASSTERPRVGEPRRGHLPDPPRTDTLVHTLDDLENLWEVPAMRSAFAIAGAVISLLNHPEPIVAVAGVGLPGADRRRLESVELLDVQTAQ